MPFWRQRCIPHSSTKTHVRLSPFAASSNLYTCYQPRVEPSSPPVLTFPYMT